MLFAFGFVDPPWNARNVNLNYFDAIVDFDY